MAVFRVDSTPQGIPFGLMMELPDEIKAVLNRLKFRNVSKGFWLEQYQVLFYKEFAHPGMDVEEKKAIIAFMDLPPEMEKIPTFLSVFVGINWVSYTEPYKWHVYFSHLGYDSIEIYLDDVLMGTFDTAHPPGSVRMGKLLLGW